MISRFQIGRLLLFIGLLLWQGVGASAAGVGQRFNLTTPLQLGSNQSAQLFVPNYYIAPSDGKIVLVIHLHGGAGAAEDQVYKARANAILFNLHLNGLSSVYQNYFGDPAKFPAITNLVLGTLQSNNILPAPNIGKLILTSFSAGYAGIREILKTPANYERIDGVLLADSLHSNSGDPTRATQMQHFLQFAREARDENKIFLLTHSSIATSGYESTTQTADYLVSGLSATWTSSSTVDSLGTQYRRCAVGHFEARGYLPAGSSDHSLQFLGMDLMMKRAMEILSTSSTNAPPVILKHPEKQNCKQGETVTLSVVATGAEPFSYQWKKDGSPLSQGTNANLILTELQAEKSGHYSVTVSNNFGSAISHPAFLNVSTRSYPILFEDDFSSIGSSNQWKLFWGADNHLPDYTINWSFDHGSYFYSRQGELVSIPRAPGSLEGTKSLRMTVNNNDSLAHCAGVNIYSDVADFSGNYAMKFDLWIQYPGGAFGAGAMGSTEMALCGLNHLGTQANWMASDTPSSDGLWFAAAGEGGTTRDYRAYVGRTNGMQIELIGSAASGLTESNHTAAVYQNLFPGTEYETSGAPGKNWVQVELSQSNNVITWKMNDVVLARRTNASAFTSGKIMLGMMDPFTSIAAPAADAFVLFDNVRVEDLSNPIDAPQFASVTETQIVGVGDTLMITASLTGTPPFTYQWRLNGTNIPGATFASHTLPSVQTNDSGTYSLVASNLAGSARGDVLMLGVTNSLPQFTAATLLTNDTFAFEVVGNPGTAFTLEASTNLTEWTIVTQAVHATERFSFSEKITAPDPQRFFRVRLD